MNRFRPERISQSSRLAAYGFAYERMFRPERISQSSRLQVVRIELGLHVPARAHFPIV